MTVQCEGTKRYLLRCQRYGPADDVGEFWCHDHVDQFGTLIRNWERFMEGEPVEVTHTDGSHRFYRWDEEARRAVEAQP